MILKTLEERQLISPPSFVISNCQYLTISGSMAYGVADTHVKSKPPDLDIYGICIPPKDFVFPNLRGEIPGFGTPGPKFNEWIQHHIHSEGQEYDFQVHSIIKFFELCRQGSPNFLDILFTREEYVLHCTQVGRMIKDNRKLFISKAIWSKFRGYAWSQMSKMKENNAVGNRKEIIEKFGYDTKYAYHIVRLLDEVEQLLESQDMDLQRAREVMKSVRRGEWKIEDIISWATEKSAALDVTFTQSTLPAKADEEEIRRLLLNCLEHHYGSLDKVFEETDWAKKALVKIDDVLNSIKGKMYK